MTTKPITEGKLELEEIHKMYDEIEEIERTGYGPAHTHPDSEYAEVIDGNLLIYYLDENGNKQYETIIESATVAAGVPHQYYVHGHIIVYTTKNNLENLVIKDKLEDFKE